MEVTGAASRAVTTVCPVHRGSVLSSTCKRANLALLANRAFSSGTALRTSTVSVDFQDQSHVQFYLNVRCSRKEKINKRLRMACGREVGSCQESVRGMDERKERKKMQKMRGGKKMGTSSSSSSSSESESSDCETRSLMKMERENTRGGRKLNFRIESEQAGEIQRGRKFDIEQFRKEWEKLSRSELMNSIPRFTSEFKIEPPLAVTIEHLQKSYNLPTTCPPPLMVVDSPAREERFSGEVPLDSRVSNSLVTVGGVAVVEDVSDAWSAAQIRLPIAQIEVCMGGKCKKAGAGEVLNAFQVAGKPGVTAGPCKCMKNCKSAVSIRIEDQEGSTNIYTGVNLEDVDVLLQKHCSTSTSVAGLSCFESQQFDRQLEAES